MQIKISTKDPAFPRGAYNSCHVSLDLKQGMRNTFLNVDAAKIVAPFSPQQTKKREHSTMKIRTFF